MKKTALLVILAFGLTSAIYAQKKTKKNDFTAEQQTTLAVKKMALNLDLNNVQQQQIKPLLAKKIEQNEAWKSKKKALKKANKKLTSDERFEMQEKALDQKIAFKNSMKRILDEEQYELFKKSYTKRYKKTLAKKLKKKKAKKKNKKIRN